MNFRFQVSGFRFQVLSFNFKLVKAKLFLLFTFCFLLFTFASCSIPNLEKPECAAARQKVKEFYSFHFDDQMKPSKENLQKREKFLTDALNRALAAPETETATDYFTQTNDYPKAFRIGECAAANETRTVFQVVLFWKDDARSEQREVKVETVKQNGKWLINSVGN
jgi:hypothetical protein